MACKRLQQPRTFRRVRLSLAWPDHPHQSPPCTWEYQTPTHASTSRNVSQWLTPHQTSHRPRQGCCLAIHVVPVVCPPRAQQGTYVSVYRRPFCPARRCVTMNANRSLTKNSRSGLDFSLSIRWDRLPKNRCVLLFLYQCSQWRGCTSFPSWCFHRSLHHSDVTRPSKSLILGPVHTPNHRSRVSSRACRLPPCS